jgi:hypothetical protein
MSVKLFTAVLVAFAPLAAAPAAAESWPSQVDATYKIEFNGFDVGTFQFHGEVTATSYTVTGDARLSALLGAFKWQGLTRSSGAMVAIDPKPAGYTFEFHGPGKDGSIKMGFTKGQVTSIAISPPSPPEGDTVPLETAHVKQVLDPLSAVLALSRPASGGPCTRRLPIFDGKQRFDLVLSYVREQRVTETRPSGQPGVAIVCRVRYQPIAGHKLNSETRHMAENDGIEIALRPVPSANLFVPHQITIPTIAGSATFTSQRIDIATRNEQIALSH